MPERVRFHDEHNQSDAIVLGIALVYPSFVYPKVSYVADFIEYYLINNPVLLGNANRVGILGTGFLSGMPATFAYTPDGYLVAIQIGMITREVIENLSETIHRNYPSIFQD